MMRAAQLQLMAQRCGPPQLSTVAVWAQRVEVLQSILWLGNTVVGGQNNIPERSLMKAGSCCDSLSRLRCYCNVTVAHICFIALL